MQATLAGFFCAINHTPLPEHLHHSASDRTIVSALTPVVHANQMHAADY
jgi:hypothetical protein